MGIETYMERALHAELKKHYEPDESFHEIKYKGSVADIKNDRGIIEIQTASFGRLRQKILKFTEDTDTTVVYPAIRSKKIVWIDPQTGEASKPRLSPRRGSFYDIFRELVYVSRLIGLENLHFRVILVDVEEHRLKNGWSSDGKKGSERLERLPCSFADELILDTVDDFRFFIPDELAGGFTVKQLAKTAKIRQRLAEKTVFVLKTMGIIEQTGKDGRAYIYSEVR